MLNHFKEATEDSFNFIMNSWLKSSRYRFNMLRDVEYYEPYGQKIMEILHRADVLLVTEPQTDLILGYIVYDPDTIYYLYVKHGFRKMGLARELMKQVPSAKYTTIYHPINSRFDLTLNTLKI